jgi:hypothetical protein
MEKQLMNTWKMGDLTDRNRVLNTNNWCCIRANVDFASKTCDFPSEQRRVSAAFFSVHVLVFFGGIVYAQQR